MSNPIDGSQGSFSREESFTSSFSSDLPSENSFPTNSGDQAHKIEPYPVSNEWKTKPRSEMNFLSRLIDKIIGAVERIFYALSHPSVATKGIAPSQILITDRNEKIFYAQYEPGQLGIQPLYGGNGPLNEGEMPQWQQRVNYALKKFSDSNKKYCQLNLSNETSRLGITENHNITLLIHKDQAGNYKIFVLDGKAQDPSQTMLKQDPVNSLSKVSIKEVLDHIKTQLKTTVQPELLKKTLQRSMDCVILPEVLIPHIIKKCDQSMNSGPILDQVVKECLDHKNEFYAKVNRLRDRMFNNSFSSTPSANSSKPANSSNTDITDWPSDSESD